MRPEGQERTSRYRLIALLYSTLEGRISLRSRHGETGPYGSLEKIRQVKSATRRSAIPAESWACEELAIDTLREFVGLHDGRLCDEMASKTGGRWMSLWDDPPLALEDDVSCMVFSTLCFFPKSAYFGFWNE